MIENMIGIFEGAIPDTLCDELMAFFEQAAMRGLSVTRQEHDKSPKLQKEDDSVFLSQCLPMCEYGISQAFLECFWKNAYAPYAEKYSILSQVAQHRVYDVKFQRTQIGGGYHIWHCEQVSRESSNRLLAFTAYLNDVEEGGETEFLYFPKRVKAKKGTVALFPASFTHTHRGNPPISNVKYIATGWVDF